MKITKATLGRLKKHSNINSEKYNYRIKLITELLIRSHVIFGNPFDGYAINEDDDDYCSMDGVSWTENDHEKKYCAGMESRYPRYIHTTFTHGLNGVEILDANSLVREILAENK